MVEETNDALIEEGDSDNDSFDDETNHVELPLSSKFDKRIQRRSDEEKEFEDEVEYDAEVSLKQRYKHYRHLASFVKDDWNKFVS